MPARTEDGSWTPAEDDGAVGAGDPEPTQDATISEATLTASIVARRRARPRRIDIGVPPPGKFESVSSTLGHPVS
jgi:hypothetical protein